MGYDAFISYSHETDGDRAKAIEEGLERFAKPWYRRRSLNVFRDTSGLSANPGLWTSISAVMEDSDRLIVLCSPDAAASPWVGREIEHWVATKPAGTILPVLTAGELAWDSTNGTFDAERSTAAPAALAAGFTEEPLWVDLRFADTPERRTLRDVQFRDAIAVLAAPMHGVAKDELIGEDIRQHRRTLRFAWGAVVTLLLLAVATVFGAAAAARNAQEAEQLADAVLAANASIEELNGDIAELDLRQEEAEQELRATEDALNQANADALAAGIERDDARADAATANGARDAALGESLRFRGLADDAERDAFEAQLRENEATDRAGRADVAAATALDNQKAAEARERDANQQADLALQQQQRAEEQKQLADAQAAAARREADAQGAIAKATRLAGESADPGLTGGRADLALLLAAEAASVQPSAGELAAAGLVPSATGSSTVVPEAHGALVSAVVGAAGIDQYLHFSCNIPLAPPCIEAPQKLGKVAVSPSGKYVAAVEDSAAIQLGEAKARLFIWELSPAPAQPHLTVRSSDLDCVTDLQWLDGDFLATIETAVLQIGEESFGCLNPLTVAVDAQGIEYEPSFATIWDAEGGGFFPCDDYAISPSGRSPLAVSADGRFASVTCQAFVDNLPAIDAVGPISITAVYDGPSLRGPEQRFDLLVTRPASVALSPSGKLLQGWDYFQDSNAVWDLESWVTVPDICPLGCFANVAVGGSDLFAGLTFGPPDAGGAERYVLASVDPGDDSGVPVEVAVHAIADGAELARVPIPLGFVGAAFADDAGDELVVSTLADACGEPDGICTGAIERVDWATESVVDSIPVPDPSTGCARTDDVPSRSGGGKRLFLERFCYDQDDKLIESSVLVVDFALESVVRELRGGLVFSSQDDRYVVTEQFDVVTKGSAELPQFGLELWDFSGTSVGQLVASRTDVRPLVSPDESILAAVPSSIVSDEGGLETWRFTAFGAAGSGVLPGSIGTRSVSFLGDNTLVGVGLMQAGVVWDLESQPYRTVYEDLSVDPCDAPGADPDNAVDNRVRSALSREGTMRAVSTDARSIELVDLETDAPTMHVDLGLDPLQRINYMFFSADARSILVNIETPNPDPDPTDWRCRNGVPAGAIVVPLQVGAPVVPLADEAIVRSSDDGRRLLTRSFDGSTLTVRDATDPTRAINTIPTSALPTTGSLTGNLYTLDPTGERIAGTNSNGRTVIWTVDDGAVVFDQQADVEPTARQDLFGLSFDHDGTRLAVKSVDQRLRIYDLARSDQEPLTRALPTDAAARVAFSPDGTIVAVDGIYLFDAATLRPIGDRLRPQGWDDPARDRGVQAMWFHETDSRSLHLFAERAFDTAAVDWRLDVEGLRARACELAGRNLTEFEFELYAIDTRYRPTCGA
jgi:hypothetical protein